MPFKLPSNPLENNALFAASEPEQPKKQEKPKKSGKPAAQQTKPEKKPAAVQKPEPEAYIRATFIVRRDLLSRLKDYAYTERREIKAVINEILEASLDEIEAGYAKRGEQLLHIADESERPASGTKK